MKIFLTGATGYLGSAIASALVQRRHDVTALVRSERVLDGMRAHRGDLRDAATYRDAARDADAVVHAAIEPGPDRLAVDRAFVEAIAGPTLIYTSTVFVLGDVDGADERTPAHGARAETERHVLERGGAVIRPGMIWGGSAWLFDNPIFIAGRGNRWPLVHRDDVADLYVRVAESGARGVFHAVTEVIRAAEVFPGRGVALEEARRELGAFADALALDQNVHATRSREIGWAPSRRFR